MYGLELTATILKLILSGEASYVKDIQTYIIQANPGSFKYKHQQKALYSRILKQIHKMHKAGLIKIKAETTELKTIKYKLCLDSNLKTLPH
jgi:hypothetical protein